MNYSQGFYNMKDYMNHDSVPPYYGNIQMPVMGMACIDNMGYIASMPFIPDSYIPAISNMPMPDGDMPALSNMPNINMPMMSNMNMPTYPTMPTMPSMPNMPNMNMPTYPTMPGMPNSKMPSSTIMPGTPMNCQQLYEYMQRMNCMENMNNMQTEEE